MALMHKATNGKLNKKCFTIYKPSLKELTFVELKVV